MGNSGRQTNGQSPYENALHSPVTKEIQLKTRYRFFNGQSSKDFFFK